MGLVLESVATLTWHLSSAHCNW